MRHTMTDAPMPDDTADMQHLGTVNVRAKSYRGSRVSRPSKEELMACATVNERRLGRFSRASKEAYGAISSIASKEGASSSRPSKEELGATRVTIDGRLTAGEGGTGRLPKPAAALPTADRSDGTAAAAAVAAMAASEPTQASGNEDDGWLHPSAGDVSGNVHNVLNAHRFHEPVASYVVRHDAWWRVGWNVIVGVVALVSTCYVPLELAFGVRTVSLPVHLTVDALFAADVVLTFFTSYPDAAKQPVTSPRLIRRRALLVHLGPGLCASLPLELLDATFAPNRNPLVLLKMIRIFKLGGAKRSLADAGAHPGLLRLMQVPFTHI